MKHSKVTTLIKVLLAISLITNLVLGVKLAEGSKEPSPQSQKSVEEASGINNFQYNVDCNTVFGYKVCTSDFVGLGESEAMYKARTHGLSPIVSFRNGKGLFVYTQDIPFRINFKVDKNTKVTEASFH